MADDAVTLEVKGLDELQHRLEELPFKFGKAAIKKALKAGGGVFRDAMVQEAPTNVADIRFPPGYLKEHLGTKIKMQSDALAGTAFVGPNSRAEYPMYQSGAFKIIRKANGRIKKVGRIAVMTVVRWLEFGTSKMAKNPFMTRAYESRKDEALTRVTEVLADEIEKV